MSFITSVPMKKLILLPTLLAASSMATAYQPMGYGPAPFPHYAPPPYAMPRYVPPRGAYPMVPPPFAFAPPYPRQRYPGPMYPGAGYPGYAVPAPVVPASGPRSAPKPVPVPGTLSRAKAVDAAPGTASPEISLPEVPARSVEKPATAKASQQAFLDMLRPIVARENARLDELRRELQGLLLRLERGEADEGDRQRLRTLAARYRVPGKILSEFASRSDLLNRIDTIPPALALAQAANESAWGSSRFAREGNNLFGIWTYDESKGIVPRGRAKGAKHLVRKFDNVDESVRYYIHTLNSHPAYQALRDARAEARARGERPRALDLAGGLVKYSAKGELYVKLIRQLINRYQLAALGRTTDIESG